MTDSANSDPPQPPANPRGYDDLQALAAEHGYRLVDLVALSSEKDPFYSDVPRRKKWAAWFAEHWRKFGGPGTHLRAFHYRLVSAESPIRKPDGKPYLNTKADWNTLNTASVSARYLETVEVTDFIDRRTDDAEENAEMFTPPLGQPRVSISGGYFAEAMSPSVEIPGIDFTTPSLTVEAFRAGQAYVVEVWIEKTTQAGILEPLSRRLGFNLLSGAGQISEIHCRRLLDRAEERGLPLRILYISDFDPAGREMPPSVARKIEFWNRKRERPLDIRLHPIALTHDQCLRWRLPRTPLEGKGASYMAQAERMAHRFGEGVTELDALEALHPGELAKIVTREVHRFLDPTLRDRVAEAWWARHREVSQIRDAVTEEYAEEIEALDRAYEGVRERYEGEYQRLEDRMDTELEPLNAAAEELHGTIVAGLEAALPDASEWEVPKARPAEEHDDVLYDSRRDYLDQMRSYKKFQNKTAPGEHRKQTRK